MLTTDHPTEETLAAFVDNRLDETARRETTEHVADCGECREIVLMAAEYQTENVTHGTFRRKPAAGIAAAMVALAVAAGLTVVFVPTLLQRDMSKVIETSRKLDRRASDGRLAGNYSYKREPERKRGAGDSAPLLPDSPLTDAEIAKSDMLQIAATAKNLHVRGVATLFVAEGHEEVDAAIADLEDAHAKAKGEERDAIAIDLSAALLHRTRWGTSEEVKVRATSAYKLANDVYVRTRDRGAAFNRALALERMESPEAINAWEAYRELDPTSEWAKEAQLHIDDLKEDLKSLSPTPPAPPPS